MPEIKEFPTTRVAYVAERGPMDIVVPRGFDRLFSWFREQRIQPSGNSLVILHDDPAKVPAESQQFETCAPVDPSVESSGVVRTKTIGGFEAATIIYQGQANRDQAYNDVYKWLKVEGYTDVGSPIETFLSQLGEELRAQIAVPVQKEKRGQRKASALNRERGAAAKKPTRRTKSRGTNSQ
jgi:DNA gyrase inhibitor GyrI